MIEIEQRGILTKESYEALHSFLTTQGEFIESKNRVLLDYSTFIDGEGIEERTRDIRLRVTNGIPEIITKVGKWGGNESRREISIMTAPGTFDALVENYAVVGLKKAVLCIRNTEVFTYKGVEFALVEVPGHSYYFEAEITSEDEGASDEAHKQIDAILEELHLTPFSEQEFYEYIAMLNKEANEVFEYDPDTKGYFANRFSL
jgi:adenylate cyclase class IV